MDGNGHWDGEVKYRPGLPGNGFDLDERPFDPNETHSSQARSSRGGDSEDKDSFMPSQYSERNYAARDGYARDAYSDAYERSRYGSRGGQRVDYNEARRSRDYDINEDDDRRVTRRRQESHREVQPVRSRSRRDYEDRQDVPKKRRDSEASAGGDRRGEHAEENPELKKWAATLAGAAVGGFAGRKAGKDDNWIPAAIGAVVGGVLGREVEKRVHEHSDQRREERHERH